MKITFRIFLYIIFIMQFQNILAEKSICKITICVYFNGEPVTNAYLIIYDEESTIGTQTTNYNGCTEPNSLNLENNRKYFVDIQIPQGDFNRTFIACPELGQNQQTINFYLP